MRSPRRVRGRTLGRERGPRLGGDAADGCAMDPEDAGDIGAAAPSGEHAENFALLMRHELRTPPALATLFAGRLKPARVRSRTMARSNSAKAPSICIIMRPAGPEVSIASVKERKSAPAADQRQPSCPAPTAKLAAVFSRRAGVARP